MTCYTWKGNNMDSYSKICDFSIKDIVTAIRTVENYEYIDNNAECTKKLWVLFGKKEYEDDWICLELGSSDNIISEIKGIIKLLDSKQSIVYKDSEFHKGEKIFEFMSYSDRTSCKYRSIAQKFDNLCFYEVNVANYCDKDSLFNNIKHKMRDSIINKVNYAEVKIAFDTKALYWNPAPATIYNQEKIILKEIKILTNKK